MDRSQNKRQSFVSQEENEKEEEKESYNTSALPNQKSRYGEKSDVDDQILLEFKRKYQKSLEAIQSFQEILELKKKHTNITHSYLPNKKKDAQEISSAKFRSNQSQEQSFMKINQDALYRIDPSKFPKLPPPHQANDQSTVTLPQLNTYQFDFSKPPPKKSFRIRGARGSHGSLQSFQTNLDFHLEPKIQTFETEEAKILQMQDEIKSPLSAATSSKAIKSLRALTKSQSTFSTPTKISKSALPINISSQLRNTFRSTERVPEPLSAKPAIPEQKAQFDKVMGEPYVKIHIKNLANFQAAPLEAFDQALLQKDEDPAHLLKSGINKGFSKFLNARGEIEWKDCEVVEYIESEKKFLIRWRHDNTTKKVTRLNLRYATESEVQFQERVTQTLDNRYRSLYMGSYKEMLQERAKEDTWMNYPMTSLNKIVKLAFGRLQHLDETDTPLILIEQLMNHYKQEVVRFSLESQTFQSDFSTFLKRFTKAYQTVRNVLVTHQDKAIEVFNIPYKDYREYKDWADSSIVDSEEVDIAKLRTFNPPSSQKIFYQSLSRYSKMKILQSQDFLVEMYDYVDLNNFLTFNETQMRPRGYANSQKKVSIPLFEPKGQSPKEIDQDSFQTRAILKRKTRIIDVKKVRTEYKLLKPLHADKSTSFVITAFKQLFNKILPKPLDFTAEFMTMVSALIRQLSDIRLFRAFREFTNHQMITKLQDIETLKEEFNVDANKIELYLYRVQQCVDELKTDIKILKNDAQEKETLKRVCEFSTVMAHDAIKTCIKHSLEEFITNLEEYYGLLPLPNLSPELEKMLPPSIRHIRIAARKKLFLPVNSNQQQAEMASISGSAGNSDKNLIKTLIVNIMEDIMRTGTFFRESFANLETSRLKPIFCIKYFARQNPKNQPQKQKKSTRQDRARQRLTSRENIYRFDEFKDRLLSDNFQDDDLTDKLRRTAAEMNERYVGRSSLGWYKFGKGQTTHEPHIYDIEEQFKKMIMSVFEGFSKLEKIDVKTSFAQTFVNSHGLEDHLINFRTRFDDLIKISLLPLLALFNILHNLDFLLVQEKHYVSDIKDLFNESADGNLGTICNEIEELENDLEFVSIRIPKIFHLGIFMLDLTEYLDKIKFNIEKYIKELKDFLQLKLDEILNANRILVEKIEDSLSIGAEAIEDYIKLKLFLESDILNSDMENIKEGVQLCQQITSYIENLYIIYNKEVLETYYISKSWIQRLSQVKMDAQVQLEASRPRLINELKQKNEEKLKQLERTKIEIGNFTNYYDTNHASHYCEKAKEIVGILEGLSEYGTKCNVYEEMLVSKKTDFSTIEVVREQFNKFYLLWEFISDKWQIKSDIWLNSPFEVLEVRDMEDLIEEGIRLLIILEEKFKNNINILELIRTYIREVNRYKDYLEILKKLKSDTWKPRHWEMLWSEMYASLSAKPDPKTVTLKKLLEDKLFTFAQLINTIYKNAQNEYNIEQEIERIEDGLTRIKDLKADTYNVGPQVDIFILKGIPLIMPKLNDYHFTIKNMLANPNYPRAFLDKLNNLEYVLKGIKKILKLCDMIQSKLFIITPIMKHKLIGLYFGKEKDHGSTFMSIYTQFKQHLDGVIKRKMNYLISLFDKTVMHEMPEMKHDVNGEDVIESLKKVCVKCNLIIHDFNVVLKQARHTCPRLYLLTDAHLTEFLSIVAEPQDIIQGMNWIFTAIKEWKIEVTSKVPFRLYGAVNSTNENIALHTKILINPQEQDGSNFYLLTLINDIEKGLKQTVRENMLKNMPAFFNNGYQYWNNFKLFRDKNLLFQNLILMNNILFYHDLTIIIAAKEYANENSKESFVANKLLMLKANMEHNLAILCEAFSYEKETNWFLLLNQFIFYIKHQLDTLNYIIQVNVQSLNTFEYLVLPKLMFEYSSKSVTNTDFIRESIISGKNLLEVSSSIQDYNYINERSSFLNHYKDIEPSNYNIVLKSFDYKKNYGFDLVPFSEPKVLTPATNRNFLTILSAFATQMGILIHGPHSRGKKEIIKGMAYLLGKEVFMVDQFSTSENFLTQLIFGTIKAGFWIIFDNVQNFSNSVLSTMAQQIGMIRHALANGEPKVRYGSTAYDMRNNQNWAFVATYSNGTTASQNIPQNLSSHFRTLNYLHPHLAYILNINFELLGVQNAAQTANKVITFFQVLSNTAENQIFFTSEALTSSDLDMLQAVHIQPTINLISQIIKHLQQMILTQAVLKINTLEVWKAIKEVVTDYVKERFIRVLLNLFNVIFQSEITDIKEPAEDGGEEENHMQRVLDTFYKDNQCSVSNDFSQKCLQLFNTIQAPSLQYKTILLVGRTETTTKTLLLETVANAITKAKNINFTLSRDLDSTPAALVLGGEEDNEKKQGLIPTFIENALSNSKLSEFTEEASSDLLRHCSKWANPETNDAVIPHNRQCDWLILEVTGSQVNSETVNVIERVLTGKTQGMVTALEGYKIRVPNSINFVLDCENLTFLSPAHVKHASLLHLESSLFSLEQEFNKKVASLLQFGEFFVNVQFLLTSLFKDLIEPILQFTESGYNKQDLLYYFSANQALNNFMSYFEIFLNECRKMEISFGNITDTEIERVEGLTELNPPPKKTVNISINVSKPTPNIEDKSLLTVSKGDIVGIRHTMVLESPENATRNIDRQTLMIESSCIFCLVWTIGVLFKAHAQPAFSKFLLDKIKLYYRDSSILEGTNPASILSHYNLKQTQRTGMVSSFDIFDYCFNVYAQKWVYWRELVIPENQEITCDFVGIRFPTKELSRFNPSIKRPSRDQRSVTEVGITKTELPSANKQIFIETETSKKFSFFLNYLIAYKKPIHVISEFESGKTTIINHKLKSLLEYETHRTFYFSVTPYLTKQQLSKNIQASLLKNVKGGYSLPLDIQGLIFIDDLNLSSSEHKPWALLKSFFDRKGWYNQDSFVRLDRVSFITASSCSFAKSKKTFDASLSNIPTSYFGKTTVSYLPEMTVDDFKNIFQEYSNPIFQDNEGKPYIKAFRHYFNQLLVFNYRNKQNLKSLSHIFGCNFTMHNVLQMFKTLTLWNWSGELSVQKFMDLWYFLLKRVYSSQFVKPKDLASEFVLEIESESVSRSNVSSIASPLGSINQFEREKLFAMSDSPTPQRSSIFDDPLKQQRENKSSKSLLDGNKSPTTETPNPEDHYNFLKPNEKPAEGAIPKHRKSRMHIEIMKRPSIEEGILSEHSPTKFAKAEDSFDNSSPTLRNSPFSKFRHSRSGSKESFSNLHDSESLKPDSPSENKLQNVQKQSKFSTFAPQKVGSFAAIQQEMYKRSSFSRSSQQSIDKDVFSEENENMSVDSFSRVASSLSDEEMNLLEKQLDLQKNEDLKHFPTESFDIISKLVIFFIPFIHRGKDQDCKISPHIIKEKAFPFNTELLNFQKKDLNSEDFKPAFRLISDQEETVKEKILEHIQKQLRDYLPDNKSAVFFFNNFTFKLSSILPNISSLLLDLQIPNQHMFLTAKSQPFYAYHVLKLSCHTLAYRIATFTVTPKKALEIEVFYHFINLLHETISISVHENRKCVFVMILDVFSQDGPRLSNRFYSSITRIFQTINALILGESLKGIFPKQQLRILLSIMKKLEFYSHFSEAHLLYHLGQIISNNLKFVIVTDEHALNISNQAFRFEEEVQKMTIIELFLRYFPQSYSRFKTVCLNDLQLSIDRKTILQEDVFPLDLDENLSWLFQNSFNYEIQFGNIQDAEYGYSVLPNYREAIMFADFIYSELKANLTSKAEAQKGTGNSLVGTIKKIKKKIELNDLDIKDLNRFILERNTEVANIDKSISELNNKREELALEIKEITKQIDRLEEDLQGFNSEESLLKKLQTIFSEVTNAILLYEGKLYTDDIKVGNFFASKFCALYAILWGHIFNLKSDDQKAPIDLDISNVNIGSLTQQTASSYAAKFIECLANYNSLKERLLSFKFSDVSHENLSLMIDIIKDNNLTTSNTKFNKLQKNIMKWIDLVVETSKFELRRDFRIKEVMSIKASVEECLQNIATRKELIDKIEVMLIEQPKLKEQTQERIQTAEKSMENIDTNSKKLAQIADNLEFVIKANFEFNNPCAANRVLYVEYIRAAALYMAQCAKYSAQIRSYLFKLILNNMNNQLNFNLYKLYDILYGQIFLINCFEQNVPMSLNFIDNLAILEMVFELELQFPLVIDPSGLVLKFLKSKYEKKLAVETTAPEKSSIQNIASAIEDGKTLAIVDFNRDLLSLIESILNWRYNQLINRIYNKHYFSNKKSDAQEPDVVIINQNPEHIEFNGVKYKVHPDFKLLLIVQNTSIHLSKILLEKVFVINNDISEEGNWCEAVGDTFLIACHNARRSQEVRNYYSERLSNENNEQFTHLSDRLQKIDFLGFVEDSVLDHMLVLLNKTRKRYIAQKAANPNLDSSVDESPLNHQQENPVIIPKSIKGILLDHSSKFSNKLARTFSFLHKNKLESKNKLQQQHKEIAPKNAFFQHSQSISLGMRDRSSSKKSLLPSRYLEGKNIQDYSNIFHPFKNMNVIIKKYNSLFKSMFLLRTLIKTINTHLGDPFAFSEFNILLSAQQAIETVKLKPDFDAEEDNENSEAIVYSFFHQLYSMLPVDHQNVLAFCYTLFISKNLPKIVGFSESTWNFILYQKQGLSAIQKIYFDPNLDQKLTNSYASVVDQLSTFENIFPPLIPIRTENSGFTQVKQLLTRLAGEGSAFHRIFSSHQQPQTISLSIPLNEVKKAEVDSAPTSDEQSPNKNEGGTPRSKLSGLFTEKRNLALGSFSNRLEIGPTPLDINKQLTGGSQFTKLRIKTDLEEFHNNNNQSSQNAEERESSNSSPVKFGDSPVIHDQSYNINFSESLENANRQEANSPTRSGRSIKKSTFARSAMALQIQVQSSEQDTPDRLVVEPMSPEKASPLIYEPRPRIIRPQPSSFTSPKATTPTLLVPEDNQPLKKLRKLIPKVEGLFLDIEKNLKIWTQFFNKSLMVFKHSSSVLPQMPNNWNSHFGYFEILAIIKSIRPDAFETFVKGALSQIQEGVYYQMPQTNFDQHIKVSWLKCPTIIFYGDESKNPTDVIELLAMKNKIILSKMSLGAAASLELALNELTRCSMNPRWFILENLNVLPTENLSVFLKTLNSTLDGDATDPQFKLWITYYKEDSSYSPFELSPDRKAVLQPFFKACFKLYMNFTPSIKSRMIEFDKEAVTLEHLIEADPKLANPESKALIPVHKKLKQHRIKLIQSEGRIDMSEFLKYSSREEESSREPQVDLSKVRYLVNFLFSVIRERLGFEKHGSSVQLSFPTLSSHDLNELLEDMLLFFEKTPQTISLSFVEKFVNLIFDSQAHIQYLFKNLVAKNINSSTIQVKDVSYNIPKQPNSQEQRLLCISTFPEEDPVQIFGYNSNNDIIHAHQRSKDLVALLSKCNDSIEAKEIADNECIELEQLILTKKHEQDLEVILEEYILIKNEQTLDTVHSSLHILSLIKKMLDFIPLSFNLSTISYFGVYQLQNQFGYPSKNEFETMSPKLSPGLKSIKSSSHQTETLLVPTMAGRRRPSVENAKDRKSEAFKMNLLQKFKNSEASGRKSRKYSFTVIDQAAVTSPGKPNFRRSPKGLLTGILNPSSPTPLHPSISHLDSSYYSSKNRLENDDSFKEPMYRFNRDIFKNLLLNEIKMCNKTLDKIRNDLEFIMKAIQGLETSSNTHPCHRVVQCLLKNHIPENWDDSCSAASQKELTSFLKTLILKYESLRVLVQDRDCQIYPVIPLQKLFDPFFLFTSMIWKYCQQNQVSFNECEVVLEKYSGKPVNRQNELGCIYASGLTISGGRIDKKQMVLEDEFSREFTSSFNYLLIKIRKRSDYASSLYEEDSSIPVVFKSHNPSSIKIVGDYYTRALHKEAQQTEKAWHPVRIPFIDPCSRSFKNSFHLELYLYIWSKRPQEYWQLKGTNVQFLIDA